MSDPKVKKPSERAQDRTIPGKQRESGRQDQGSSVRQQEAEDNKQRPQWRDDQGHDRPERSRQDPQQERTEPRAESDS